MEEVKYGIKKLSSENYENWVYKIQLYLMKEGLWNIVSQAKPENADNAWIENDTKAKAIIGLSVEDSQIVHIRGKETAKEYWESLKNQHQKNNLSNKVFLLKKLCQSKYDESGNIEDYIFSFVNICSRLSGIGQDVDEKLKVALLLSGMPESYNVVVTTLEIRSEDDLTFDLVKEKLVQESKRRCEMLGNDGKALKVFNKKGNFGVSNGEKKNDNNHNKTNSQSDKGCFYCGRSGHIKANCYFYKKHLKNNEKAKCVHDKEDKEICLGIWNQSGDWKDKTWILDSAATSHMSNNRKFFENYHEINRKIFLADGSFVESVGIGNGRIKLYDESNNVQSCTLENVLFIPKLDGNLLSVPKIVEKGCKVNFLNRKAEIMKNDKIIGIAKMTDGIYLLKTEVEKMFKITEKINVQL